MAFDVELIVVEDTVFTYTAPAASVRSFRENQNDHTYNLGSYVEQSNPITTSITVGTITGTGVEDVEIAKDGENGTYGSSITLDGTETLTNIWIRFDTTDISGGNQTVTINFTTVGGPD